MNIDRIKNPGRAILDKVIPPVKGKGASSYFRARVFEKFISNPDSVLYVATEKEIVGYGFLTYLRWDSGIFGFKIGRIENLSIDMGASGAYRFLNRIIRDCRKEHYAHIHCRLAPEDPVILRALKRLKFKIADRQITLTTDGSFTRIKKTTLPEGIIIDRAGKGDLPYIKELVRGIFSDTRFVMDPGYPGDKVDRMYYEWIKNSISDPSRIVFIVRCKPDSRPAAFSICSIEPDSSRTLGYKIGAIELIAVKKECRNKGMGKKLVGHCLAWLNKRCDKVEIRTQVSNAPAIKAFRKGGFRKFTSGTALPAGMSLHRWF